MILLRAGALAAHTLHVLLLTAQWCSGAGAVLRAQPARPGVFAAGQMLGTEPGVGKPRAGLSLPKAKATSSSPAREVQAEGKEPKLLLLNDHKKSS